MPDDSNGRDEQHADDGAVADAVHSRAPNLALEFDFWVASCRKHERGIGQLQLTGVFSIAP
jgi:hypothetical protein